MARFEASCVTVDQIMAELDSNGYCFVHGVLSEAEAIATRDELRAILNGGPTGRNAFEGYKTKRMYGLFAKTRRFDRLATMPLLLDVIGKTLKTEFFNLSAPTGIDIGPNERTQIPHRDDGKYPLPIPHQEVVINTMWALDDFTEYNGATLVWPETQIGGKSSKFKFTPTETHSAVLTPDRSIENRRTRSGESEAINSKFASGFEAVHQSIQDAGVKPIKAIMPKGSVMIYKGSLLHGGGANETSTPRLGVILEYCAGWLRPQENHLLAVPRETAALLNPDLQDLLGYNMVPPFIGYQDGRHPREVLKPYMPSKL